MEEKVDSRLKLEGDICQILGQVYCNENNSGKEVDAMYCMDASDKIADFILRHTEELMKENEELNKQVGAALGTADHYCKENDRLKALVSESKGDGIDDVFLSETTGYEED